MTALPVQAGEHASFDRFLAADFARVGTASIDRCRALSGRRLYLTGATGFFGKNLLALFSYLHKSGVELSVTALSRAPNQFLHKHSWCRDQPWLEWRQGDVAQAWPGDGNYDLLLHAGTDTHAQAHVDKEAVFDRILAGTRRALEFVTAHGVRRLLITGSGAQYGEIPAAYSHGIPETSLLACDPARAASAYGEGKRVSELLAALHAERSGLEIVNTRCFSFVGPGLALDGHFAIGNFLQDALHGRDIKMASAGAATRSYLYGADLALWLAILLLEARAGSAVNIGSDHAVTILDLASLVRDLVSPQLQVQVGSARPGEERHMYVPRVDYARQLGLDVWTGLDEAILRTALWHREGVLA